MRTEAEIKEQLEYDKRFMVGGMRDGNYRLETTRTVRIAVLKWVLGEE